MTERASVCSALAALHASAFCTPRPWSADEIAQILADPHVFLVSRQNGFALGRIVADEAELLTIAVAPDARRGGLGREMLAEVIATAQERGAKSLFLEVAADNAVARALYSAAGFDMIGQRRAYYRCPNGAAVDALVLGKTF